MAAVRGRDSELARIERILERGVSAPSFLCLVGEPGIGKTTLLNEACGLAARHDVSVLSCSPASVESHLGYAALGDLLAPLLEFLPGLPEPQQWALEAALLRRTRMGQLPDTHTVAAATLSLLDRGCRRAPLLVAIDDVQWLDVPSARALAFAMRRLVKPHTLMLTLRAGHDLPLAGVAGSEHSDETLTLTGLALAPLSELLRGHGHDLDRPTMQRIMTMSGGNPLFARELARTRMTNQGPAHRLDLGSELEERYRRLSDPTREALLLASLVADPTAALLEQAGIDEPAAALTEAETSRIASWRGGHLVFTHPMWREVAYRSASAADRRTAHARVAQTALDLEERARHQAMSSPLLDATTRAALEDAATSARLRGAPSTAAELLGLALERGATDPELVLQAAQDHFASGGTDAARSLARQLLDGDAPARIRAAALHLSGAVSYLTDDFTEAIPSLNAAYVEAVDPAIRAGIAIDLAFAHANLGLNAAGLEWMLRAEQDAATAGDPAVMAEAAGGAAVLVFLSGGGVDRRRLRTALAGEDVQRQSQPQRWPSMSSALILLWSGHLGQARPALHTLHRRYEDRGLDAGLTALLARLAEAAMLDGDIGAAERWVAAIEDRAKVAGDQAECAMALACRVVLAAFAGEMVQAVAAHGQLQEVTGGTRHLMPRLAASAALGAGHLSTGHAEEAAVLLEAVAGLVLALGVGEPVVTPFVADAVDAMSAVGRASEALPLVEMYESWSQRSGTAWPAGVAARGRALLLLDQGDLQAADSALDRAMDAFDPRSHRYERARTLIVRAAVHRRRRGRTLARDTLVQAREGFAELGAFGWRTYTEREIAHLGLGRSDDGDLTPSEQRIATLAASGHTNTEVARRLSISPKTVEAHLTRVYGKLGIHSRAELGRWVAEHPEGRRR